MNTRHQSRWKEKVKQRKAVHTKAGRDLIEALTEVAEALESGEPLENRFTVRTVTRLAEPGEYDSARVRATRQRIGASQPVFAQLVGVSTILAQSWEQGLRVPSKLARRLLDEINHDPARWRRMMTPSRLSA